jgi:succinate-semialdehyde dehydrogenase/glutarate-semialdehyde dehydrogenase
MVSGLLAAQATAARDFTLAVLLTMEQGKSLAEAKGEVGISPPMCCGSPRKARRTYGDTMPSPWADRRIW